MKCNYCQKAIYTNLKFREILWPFLIKNHQLCPECQATFMPIDVKTACPGCCRPYCPTLCTDCQKWQRLYPHYEFQHRALFVYNAGMKNWLADYKFKGDYALARVFTANFKKMLKNYPDFLLCPIPLSEEKEFLRGFNQVEGFFKVGNLSYKQFLVKTEDHLAQSQKKRHERLATPQTFSLAVPVAEIKQQKILIVDDVYTTGRTLFHAAELFLQAGAKEVRTCSLAR